MRPSVRWILVAGTALALVSCAKDAAPTLSGPLTQQDAEESVTAISQQLQTALMRAANDEGILALQGLPFSYNETPDPLREIGYAPELPRGIYRYDLNTFAWVLTTPSDDLSLTWFYSDAPTPVPIPEPLPDLLAPTTTREATLVFDWDASSPTRTVLKADGSETEVPTGLSLTLTANGTTAADLEADLGFYEGAACTAGILEPTSLSVSGASSVLTFEDVGYTLQETEIGDSLNTAGKLTLVQDGIYLGWDITVEGDLGRLADCFSHTITLGGGTFAAELGGFTGDTRSIALSFGFNNVLGSIPEFSDGAVVINGDESRAITFSGPLTDDNGNGYPGDTLSITFADGSSTTLEQLLQDWYTNNPLGRLLRLR